MLTLTSVANELREREVSRKDPERVLACCRLGSEYNRLGLSAAPATAGEFLSSVQLLFLSLLLSLASSSSLLLLLLLLLLVVVAAVVLLIMALLLLLLLSWS